MGGGKKARKAAERQAKRAERERKKEQARIAAEKAEQTRIETAKAEEVKARAKRGLAATILDDEDEVLGA